MALRELSVIAIALGCLLGAAAPASAAVRYVANNGVDDTDCRTSAQPCRTLSHAILVAQARDKVLVGPGRYGDLNGDGILTAAEGEESGGCGGLCMIWIDKALTLESSAGADVTIIAGGRVAVLIDASDVAFGTKKQGFTITGATEIAVWLPGGTGSKVEDNIVHGNPGKAFVVAGDGHRLTGNVATLNGFDPQAGTAPFGYDVSGTGHTLTGNESAQHRSGFNVEGSRHSLTGNVATNNDFSGFFIEGSEHAITGNEASNTGTPASSGPSPGRGFFINGTGHTVTRNVASRNVSEGFAVSGSGHALTSNVASNNGGDRFSTGNGFNIVGSGHTITSNTASANHPGFGFALETSSGTEFRRNAALGNAIGIGVVDDGSAVMIQNNIFGNRFCGLQTNGVAVNAPNNFWGAATGPGADPADDDCGGNIVTAPFASKAFSIPVNAGR